MTINFSIGLLVLILMFLAMLFSAFGVFTVPLLAWMIFLAVGIILVAIGK